MALCGSCLSDDIEGTDSDGMCTNCGADDWLEWYDVHKHSDILRKRAKEINMTLGELVAAIAYSYSAIDNPQVRHDMLIDVFERL